MSEKEGNKVAPKSTLETDFSGAGRSGTVSPKSIKNPSNLSQAPRRFSSSSTRSYDTNDYYSTSPVNQRVSSAMSLYGRGYNRSLTRRISLNSSISNFSTMSETSLPWTTKDIGFNAISGVLNDPNAKASNTARPTKNDIPSVPQTVIKKVKPTDFNSYLKQITPLFERYSHNKECGVENSHSIRKSTSSFESVASTTKILTNLENLQTDNSEIPVHRLESSRNPYSVRMPPYSLDDDRPIEPVIDLPLLET
ncbi:11203_t:CDS:2, partial [Dentiscutata heterogama]